MRAAAARQTRAAAHGVSFASKPSTPLVAGHSQGSLHLSLRSPHEASRPACPASGVAHYSSRIPGSSRPSRVRTRGPGGAHVQPQRQKQHAETTSAASSSSAAPAVAADTSQGQAASSSAPTAASSPRLFLDHATVAVARDETGTSVIDSSEALRQSVATVLGQPSIVVTREVEMLNIFMGFEQANKYGIVTPEGQQIGYLAEQETGIGGTMKRQFLKTHRPFEAHILDLQGRVILSIKRGLTWINSKTHIHVVDPDTAEQRLVGEVRQVWHPWRRKYELFTNRAARGGEDEMVQFASIDGALLTWDFIMTDEDSRPLGAVTRNFRGFGREIFTDTGQYVLTFDPSIDGKPEALEAPQGNNAAQQGGIMQSETGRELLASGPARSLSMDERAVALATAVSADFDYFSRHSHQGHGGFFPFFGFGGGGAQQAEQAEGEGGAETSPTSQKQDSSGVEAPPTAPGADGGLGPAVGTGIGYEAMGGGRQSRGDDAFGQGAPGPSADTGAQPTSNDPYGDGGGFGQQAPTSGWGDQPGTGDMGQGQEQVWGSEEPWADSPPTGGGDSGGGGWSIFDIFGGDD